MESSDDGYSLNYEFDDIDQEDTPENVIPNQYSGNEPAESNNVQSDQNTLQEFNDENIRNGDVVENEQNQHDESNNQQDSKDEENNIDQHNLGLLNDVTSENNLSESKNELQIETGSIEPVNIFNNYSTPVAYIPPTYEILNSDINFNHSKFRSLLQKRHRFKSKLNSKKRKHRYK